MWEKITDLLLHRYTTCVLCGNRVDENRGEDHGCAGALLEDAVDEICDVGSCIRHSSSLITIIRTGINKNEVGFELWDLGAVTSQHTSPNRIDLPRQT
jgi:hypothetical protein